MISLLDDWPDEASEQSFPKEASPSIISNTRPASLVSRVDPSPQLGLLPDLLRLLRQNAPITEIDQILRQFYRSPRHLSAIELAIEKDQKDILALLFRRCWSKTALLDNDRIPMLGYALLQSPPSRGVIEVLLQYGADPRVIPAHLWKTRPITPTNPTGAYSGGYTDDLIARDVGEKARWCTQSHLNILTKALEFDYDLKYQFQRACSSGGSSKEKGIASLLKVPSLAYLPHGTQAIGAEESVARAVKYIKSYLTLPLVAKTKQRPLVLMLVGPRGHGKTAFLKGLVENTMMAPLESLIGQYNLNEAKQTSDAPLRVFYRDMQDCPDLRETKHLIDFALSGERNFSRTLIVLITSDAEQIIIDHDRQHLDKSENPKLDIALSNALLDAYGHPFMKTINGIIPFKPLKPMAIYALISRYVASLDARWKTVGCSVPLPKKYEHYRTSYIVRIRITDTKVFPYLASMYNPRRGTLSLSDARFHLIQVPASECLIDYLLSNSEDQLRPQNVSSIECSDNEDESEDFSVTTPYQTDNKKRQNEALLELGIRMQGDTIAVYDINHPSRFALAD